MTNPFNTGAKPRTKKPTDYHADAFNSAKASPTPPAFQTSVPTIYMQNKEPSCGADSMTQYLNILFGFIGSPEFTWKNIRKIDGFPADDGSTSDTLAVEAKTVSTCDLALMPDNSTVDPAIYAGYYGITPEMIVNASSRKIANYAFIDNPTFQQIKDNIFNHKAVILRVDCGDGWYANGWQEAEVCPLKLGNFESGHFILATGFDEKYIYFANSWSEAWGRQGMGYFDTSYMPHVHELVVFIPPVTPVTPQPATYQFLKNFGFGSVSADVHALQIRLGVNPTGYFGPLTFAAVIAYQFKHGILTTGYCGPLTRQSLNT